MKWRTVRLVDAEALEALRSEAFAILVVLALQAVIDGRALTGTEVIINSTAVAAWVMIAKGIGS